MPCIFDDLPDLVLENMFNQLSHQTLFTFSYAYPQYSKKILNPIYWKNLEFNRSHSSFTSNDISIIVKHVNNHLKQLKFDKHFKIDSSVFLKVISACPNLQFLRLPIIENVQENFMQE
jgi:hypothetical protein